MNNDLTCPFCKAKRHFNGDNFVREKYGWRCKTCFGVFTDERTEKITRLKEVYNDLQRGRFEDVKKSLAALKSRGDETLNPWFDYVGFRAEYGILGPIVDASGNNIGCFTPCNIELFSRGKLQSGLNRIRGNGDGIERAKCEILSSADEYSEFLEKYRRGEDSREFDVFICHKTDGGSGKENTADYALGLSMYKELKKRGVKVFFAPETKKTLPGMQKLNEYDNNWRKWIYDALLSSRIMILIATREEYLNAPNVRNEWATFTRFILDGYYGKKRIYPVFAPEISNTCLSEVFAKDAAKRENYFETFTDVKGEKFKLNGKSFAEVVESSLNSLEKPEVNKIFGGGEDALIRRAQDLETAGDAFAATDIYAEAFKRYRSDTAAVKLGLYYLHEDPERAFRYFSRSASPEGVAATAYCLYRGAGCEKDEEAAYALLDDSIPLHAYYRALWFVDKVVKGESDGVWADTKRARRAVENLKNITHISRAKILYGICLYAGILINEDELEAKNQLAGTEEYAYLFN